MINDNEFCEKGIYYKHSWIYTQPKNRYYFIATCTNCKATLKLGELPVGEIARISVQPAPDLFRGLHVAPESRQARPGKYRGKNAEDRGGIRRQEPVRLEKEELQTAFGEHLINAVGEGALR